MKHARTIGLMISVVAIAILAQGCILTDLLGGK